MALPRKNANLAQVINVSGNAIGNTISIPRGGIVNINGSGYFSSGIIASGISKIGGLVTYLYSDGDFVAIKNSNGNFLYSSEEYCFRDTAGQFSLSHDSRYLYNSSGDPVLFWGQNIGIKQQLPLYDLDVGGTGNFSKSLLVNGTGVSISGHTHAISDINIFTSSGLASRISDETGSGLVVFNNSPTLTGIPLTPTASSGTNTNQIASTAFVRTEISNLVASAPATLDTLNELATALGNDANFSTTVTNNLAGKANLSGSSFTGTVTGPTGNFTVLQQNGTSVSIVGHSHTASNITDFNSSVSGLVSGVYVPNTRTITPGSGLVGNSSLDLSANRTIDIGQGDGLTVSADSIAVNSTVVRTTGNQAVSGVKTFSDTLVINSPGQNALGASQLYLNGDYNRIDFNTNGVAPPVTANRSLGKKIVLYPSASPGLAEDFSFGIAGDGFGGGGSPTRFWQTINNASSRFEWYASDQNIATLSGSGIFIASGIVAGSGSFSSGLNVGNQTANTIAGFDASKNVASLSTATYPSLTELSYVKGVTSAVQTQLNDKSATGHTHTTANITDFNSGVSGLLPTVINSGNNRVLTSTGSAVGVSGQSNLVFTGSNLGVNTSSPSGAIHVVGTGLVSSVTGTIPNHLFHVYSATSGANIFNVEGTNGSLFSVVDSLSGSLMSVNNNAGLPVFEVFSDDRVIAGRFNQNDLVVTSGGNIGVGIGSPVSKMQISGLLTANSGNFTNSLQVNGTGVSISGHSHSISDISTFSSSALAARVTDETGSGSLVFSSGATLFNPSVFGAINIGDGVNYTPTLIMNGDNGEFFNITQAKASFFMPIELDSPAGGATERLSLRMQAASFLGTPANVVGVVASGHWRAATILPDKGGTGRTSYSNGQLLIGSGTSLAANTLTAGTGINIANGSGTITVAVTGLINNPANNRILTSRDSTTTGIDAESNLTFDGSGLVVTGNARIGNLRLETNTLSSTSGNIIISPTGSGAIQRDSGGNNRGQYAIDLQRVTNNVNVASANYSTIAGGQDNRIEGTYGAILNGNNNFIGAEYSTILGGINNAIYGESSISFGTSQQILGDFCSSYGSNNRVVGDYNCNIGKNNSINANYGTIFGEGCAIGYPNLTFYPDDISDTTLIFYEPNTALIFASYIDSGNYDVKYYKNNQAFSTTVISQYIDSAGNSFIEFDIDMSGVEFVELVYSNSYAVAIGKSAQSTKYGELSHSAGAFSLLGDAQHSVLIARQSTNNATANQSLFLDGIGKKLIIPPKTNWTFSIKISAYNVTDNAGAWWIIRGGIRRNNSDSTSLIGSLITENGADSAMSSADISVIANSTDESLDIRVTGIANKTIRWAATIDLTQVMAP